MLKVTLQCFGHLMRRANSLEKTMMLGKFEGKRGWDGWMVSSTQWTWVWASSGRWWRVEKPGVLQSWGCEELDVAEWLNNNNWVIHMFPKNKSSERVLRQTEAGSCSLLQPHPGSDTPSHMPYIISHRYWPCYSVGGIFIQICIQKAGITGSHLAGWLQWEGLGKQLRLGSQIRSEKKTACVWTMSEWM